MFLMSDVNAFVSVWARADARAAHVGYEVYNTALYVLVQGYLSLHIFFPLEAKPAAYYLDRKREKGRQCENIKLLSV